MEVGFIWREVVLELSVVFQFSLVLKEIITKNICMVFFFKIE
jgi:hypothetical protein